LLATSEHGFTACGTGHDSLPWAREARETEAESDVLTMGAGSNGEGDVLAAD